MAQIEKAEQELAEAEERIKQAEQYIEQVRQDLEQQAIDNAEKIEQIKERLNAATQQLDGVQANIDQTNQTIIEQRDFLKNFAVKVSSEAEQAAKDQSFEWSFTKRSEKALFTRNSTATLPDGTVVQKNEPRFIGNGILIEAGDGARAPEWLTIPSSVLSTDEGALVVSVSSRQIANGLRALTAGNLFVEIQGNQWSFSGIKGGTVRLEHAVDLGFTWKKGAVTAYINGDKVGSQSLDVSLGDEIYLGSAEDGRQGNMLITDFMASKTADVLVRRKIAV
ncbi:hypothetical protein DCC39_10255 [Pueribacillus theae]|uniref:Uncharacterized protein n=1 Tax=Pueribacillus theae TaxID=2171751 RepID=A0A2U1K0S3_9BACI|nr:hypothetical protein [Pueribacillus theae]PWA11071.1 hypothetical protein DCC39_10255 [Pueribacillus theae]